MQIHSLQQISVQMFIDRLQVFQTAADAPACHCCPGKRNLPAVPACLLTVKRTVHHIFFVKDRCDQGWGSRTVLEQCRGCLCGYDTAVILLTAGWTVQCFFIIMDSDNSCRDDPQFFPDIFIAKMFHWCITVWTETFFFWNINLYFFNRDILI